MFVLNERIKHLFFSHNIGNKDKCSPIELGFDRKALALTQDELGTSCNTIAVNANDYVPGGFRDRSQKNFPNRNRFRLR
jgi:hypothetical protein